MNKQNSNSHKTGVSRNEKQNMMIKWLQFLYLKYTGNNIHKETSYNIH